VDLWLLCRENKWTQQIQASEGAVPSEPISRDSFLKLIKVGFQETKKTMQKN
jgi:hypothetical protein